MPPNAYASGNWQVEATGETISVPSRGYRAIFDQSPQALARAYMTLAGEGRDMLKALFTELGLLRETGRSR